MTRPAFDAHAYAARVAARRGWVLNADEGFTGPLLAGLATQTARFEKPFCPCRDTDGQASDRDIVCPCAYAADDIAECGQCYCGLFLAAGKDLREISSIPERRAPDQGSGS